ncbi:MAG: alpha-N-arabinofuranosidase [Ruminococcus sp.]|nr:alpha-N-arabinofuranosidase [Ruminococcus sp.]
MKAKITINTEKTISQIDERIYGSFIEHLGRAVYGGIYEPSHETADDMGFRGDVLECVKKLNVPIVRYPGGNFVSGYNWEDGTGKKELRPKKLDLAWQSIETNEVGIDEFQEWAKRVGTEIMMAVNLGTRGPDEARNIVEYCNLDIDTYYANKRKENGFEKPFGIKLWCLGNEMDGPWQICCLSAEDYAKKACETAKVMKLVDPGIELVACGSSHIYMPTFGTWEETVLRKCYEHIDYISLHNYYGNPDNDTPKYLSQSESMDRFIKTVAGICDKVKAEKNTDKTINLSFDEWNVWFHSAEQDKKIEKYTVAPPLLEDIYNFEDALVVGSLLITLINNSDRVKIACLAQLVNVIAPIMTRTGGGMWAQTIFYPYLDASIYGRGTALKTDTSCETYNTAEIPEVPYLTNACVNDGDGNLTVFAVNRSLDEEIQLDIDFEKGEKYTLYEHTQLFHNDLKAENSEEKPDEVKPENVAVTDRITLLPHSWNVLKFKKD